MEMTPLDPLARAETRVLYLVAEMKSEREMVLDFIKNLRSFVRGLALRSSERKLLATRAELIRAGDAVIANFDQWKESDEEGRLMHRVMQILSGYGCVGKYLYRIFAGRTAEYRDCNAEVDSVQRFLSALGEC